MARTFTPSGQKLQSAAGAQDLTSCPKSVSAWIKLTALPVASSAYQFQTIYACTDAGPNYTRRNIMLDYRVNAGTYYFNYEVGNGATGSYIWCGFTYTVTLSLNTWYHVLFMLDPNGNLPYAYINGTAVSVSMGNTAGCPAIDSSVMYTCIGNMVDFSGTYFYGTIADVAVYDRILSSDEAKGLYRRPASEINPMYVQCDQNLLGYWDMEETTGNRVSSDSSAGALTPSAGVSYGTGKIGTNAVALSAASSTYLYKTTAQYRSITIAAWIKLNTLPAYRCAVAIVTGNGYINSAQTFVNTLGVTSTGAGSAYAWDGSVKLANSSAGVISTGTWYHIAMTASFNRTVKLYVNGVNLATTSIGQSAYGSNYLVLGGVTYPYNNGADAQNYFDGLIDGFGYWYRELNATEIGYLYNGGTGRTYSELRDYTTKSAKLLHYPVWGDHSPEIGLTPTSPALTVSGSPTKSNHAPISTYSQRWARKNGLNI